VDPTAEAVLRSWPFDPWVVGPLVLTAWVYVRGWKVLRRRGSTHFRTAQLAAFLGGLAAIGLALASPIEPFSTLLLQVHMVQHLLLMMVAPPLLLLGAPALPLLRGLPLEVRRYWIGPFLREPLVQAGFRRLTHPLTAWVLFVGSTVLWHTPLLFDRALESDGWHYAEHAFFLGTALLFWWPVVQPYPSRPQVSRWVLIPFLLLADVQNTLLSAILTFSEQVIYPHYETVPRLWGVSPLDDQAIAGVLMWVPGSLAYLVPLVVIGSRLLYGRDAKAGVPKVFATLQTGGNHPENSEVLSGKRLAVSKTGCLPLCHTQPMRGKLALPLVSATVPPPRRDLLGVPLVGRFLRWKHARLALQLPLLGLAVAVIFDGLLGPDVAPMNLAGVLPWIHWRGLVVLGLLVAGNVFCLACPFMLPRTVARKWLPARHRWPRALRSKWLAVGLLVLFFWAYEAFQLWASPWWTAWIALAYFIAAFAIDACFQGAAFCKYVCPIGQFHFVQSLVSPLEVKVREPAVCLTCSTKDCIRGGGGIPGCELHLFQPRKSSNMDCTFCLDCIHACPHDNIGILATAPGSALIDDPHRSGIGRFGRRHDLAALVLVLVFAAFANAAGMVAPVVDWQDRWTAQLGLSSSLVVVTASLAAALLMLPVVLIGTAASISRWWSGTTEQRLAVALRFAYALVPLGAGMWLAHYAFHFFTSADAVVPVAQRVAGDLGLTVLGPPAWGCNCCAPVANWLLRLEIVFLDLGLLLSLYLGYRIAQQRSAGPAQTLKAFAPWGVLMLLLFALGLWILFQPMEMRGTMLAVR
jgi:cytochrome c oxidase assembly factor CtaG